MKHVLVLTGRYLPNMSANGICINNILQKLPVSEYQITCLCYDDLETVQDDKVKIIRVSRGILRSFLYKHERNTNSVVKVFRKAVSLLVNVLCVPFLICWPWNDPVFTSRVLKIAERLHKDKPIDFIIAVHAPISSLIVANKMKKKYPEIKYIPYFLDSLSGGRPATFLSEKTNLKKKLRWEELLLQNADKIVVMEASRKHHETYSSQMSYYNKFLYLDIPLLCGHEKTSLKNPFPANDEIRVVYTGVALQPMRNIPYFVELAKKVNAIDPRIVFYVIGQSNCANMFNHKCIRYLDSMPHEQLLPYLEYADVLINLGVRVPSAISGKIFEYMSFGKPIISTYSIPNEACITYLNRYPMSLLIEESDSGIEQAAKEMVDFISSNLGNRIDFNDIKSIYKNNLPETFIEEVFES